MRVLITAGATQTPIDKVRAITNIFKGTTGSMIAEYFASQNANVTLITSNPELAKATHYNYKHHPKVVFPYRTFDELAALMQTQIQAGNYDAVVHSAAVSDYRVVATHTFQDDGVSLQQVDAATKISSKHSKLFLELEQTPKLIDKIRGEWGYRGFLVKFKLEVGKSEEELLQIARESRKASRADLIVANCLEWCKEKALILSEHMHVEQSREALPELLYNYISAVLEQELW